MPRPVLALLVVACFSIAGVQSSNHTAPDPCAAFASHIGADGRQSAVMIPSKNETIYLAPMSIARFVYLLSARPLLAR